MTLLWNSWLFTLFAPQQRSLGDPVMQHPLHFDDLQVGDRWQSQGRTITEADIVNFASMTGDFDPLHVDHEFAAQTPFRKPIAHGLLGLAWLAGLSSKCPFVKTDAFVSISDWEFHKPMFVGDTVHVVTEVQSLEARGRRRGLVTWHRKLVNQVGEVVQSGNLETLVAAAANRDRARPSIPTIQYPKSTNDAA